MLHSCSWCGHGDRSDLQADWGHPAPVARSNGKSQPRVPRLAFVSNRPVRAGIQAYVSDHAEGIVQHTDKRHQEVTVLGTHGRCVERLDGVHSIGQALCAAIEKRHDQ